jgi:hypothetical protein
MQGWYAPSLTSNKETGLGDWSLQDIDQYLQTGIAARGAVLPGRLSYRGLLLNSANRAPTTCLTASTAGASSV